VGNHYLHYDGLKPSYEEDSKMPERKIEQIPQYFRDIRNDWLCERFFERSQDFALPFGRRGEFQKEKVFISNAQSNSRHTGDRLMNRFVKKASEVMT
jgi:hypothetical protein